jgi:hypothetical protein
MRWPGANSPKNRRPPLDCPLSETLGMNSEEQPRRVWGKALLETLAPMPLSDRAEFLQYLEAKAKAEADFETMKEIQAYKAMSRSNPTSTKPPESA